MFSQISRVCPFSDYVDYRPFHDWKYFFLQTLHKYVQFSIKIDFNKLKLKYFYNEYERYFFLNITQCRKTRLILFPFWVHESADTRGISCSLSLRKLKETCIKMNGPKMFTTGVSMLTEIKQPLL